jgi:hypothetical protein
MYKPTIKIECFNGLPFDYESFLIDKYDSYVASCNYIEIFHKTENINHMLIYENDNLQEVIMFEIAGDTATCLNSLTFLNLNIFKLFTSHIFEKFLSIKKISYPSSYNDYSLDKSILWLRSDDYVLQLPITIDEYFQQLGSSTRSNVRKHKKKFFKDYPQAKFVTKIGNEIDENLIDKIIQLNFDRIKSKQEIPHVNHTHTNNYYKYSQFYGCVSYIEVDGVIVAGCIAYMSNKSIYSQFVAHDNNFSMYNAGQLCMIYLIQISIEKEFKEFHLLWGECEYKTRFLAKARPMYSYMVFKKFSSHYVLNKVKEAVFLITYKFKASKYASPLKSTLKNIRKKSTKQLCKLEYIILLLILLNI